MTNDRVVENYIEWNPISAGLTGRPKIIWEDDIIHDIRIMIIIIIIIIVRNVSRTGLNGRKVVERAEISR